MSKDDSASPAPNDALRAAEYVLGLLPEAEHREIEGKVVVDPSLRSEVVFWNNRFAELADDEVVSVAPPPQVKTWTEELIFGGAKKPGRRKRKRRRTSRLRPFFWGTLLGGTGVAVVAAAFLAAQAGLRLPVDVPPDLLPEAGPAYVAHLTPDTGEMIAIARTTGVAGAGLMEVFLVSPPSASSAWALWLLPADADASPVPLGLLPASGRVAMPLGSSIVSLLSGARLAIAPTNAATDADIDPGAFDPEAAQVLGTLSQI